MMQVSGQLFKRQFAMETVEGTFEGFTAGHTWNGFQLPLFEKAEALRMLVLLGDAFGFEWHYDEKFDCFVVGHPQPEFFDPETAEACQIVDADGNPHTVYGIGYGMWIWETPEALKDD
jgi:hypothetical protein